jgi:hypothetical protein
VGLALFVTSWACVLAYTYHNRESRWLQPAVVKLVLGFFQLVSTMERSFAVVWPRPYGGVLHSVKVALASVADLPHCVFEIDWYGRMIIWTFSMLAVALCLCGWAGYNRCLRASAFQEKHRLVKRLYYFAYFCYPLVAPVLVSIFECRTVDSIAYIVADYRLRCEGTAYALATTWAAVWTMGFLVGYPAAIMHAIRSGDRAIAFLEADYRQDTMVARMWDVLEQSKKLLLSSAILLVPEGSLSRIAIALLISVFFQVLQAFVQPFRKPDKNRLADATGAALSLTYYSALLIKARPVSKGNAGLGALLVLILVLVVIAGLVALWRMRKMGLEALRPGTIEMQAFASSVSNPAYGESAMETAIDESDTARVRELQNDKQVCVAQLHAERLKSAELRAEVARLKKRSSAADRTSDNQ